MAVIKLGLGAVNITDYLIVIARKVSDPTVIAAQEVYTPEELATPLNVVIPSTGNLDAATYYLDFRESPDGVTLGLLLTQMVYDAKRQIPISETRFYMGNGSRPIDPAAGQSDLIDSYLDAKNITSVYKEGVGPLAPPDSGVDTIGYSPIIGGGIHLENGQKFNNGELLTIVITYIAGIETTEGNQSLYNGIVDIINTMTLDSSYRNKRINCGGTAAHLVITLEDVADLPDRTFWYFSCNSGNQSKIRLMAKDGQYILFQGEQRPELSFGKGQYLRIEKYNDYIEVVLYHEGIGQVGEEFVKGVNTAVNAIVMDGRQVDGDDEPGLFYYVDHLPLTHVIVDNTLAPQPAGKEGLWVKQATGRGFRVPNMQGFSSKALNSFTTFGADATRSYDYPGGSQPEKVGQHGHYTLVDLRVNDGGFPTTIQNLLKSMVRYFNKNGGTESMYAVGGGDHQLPTISPTSNPIILKVDNTPVNVSGDQAVKNIGKIYFVRS